MLKIYFRSIARLLRRQKGYAVISAFSPVLGMTCFILLTVFVRYELGYDSFRPNADRISKVGQREANDGPGPFRRPEYFRHALPAADGRKSGHRPGRAVYDRSDRPAGRDDLRQYGPDGPDDPARERPGIPGHRRGGGLPSRFPLPLRLPSFVFDHGSAPR